MFVKYHLFPRTKQKGVGQDILSKRHSPGAGSRFRFHQILLLLSQGVTLTLTAFSSHFLARPVPQVFWYCPGRPRIWHVLFLGVFLLANAMWYFSLCLTYHELPGEGGSDG